MQFPFYSSRHDTINALQATGKTPTTRKYMCASELGKFSRFLCFKSPISFTISVGT